MNTTKNILKTFLSLFVSVIITMSFASCKPESEEGDLWQNAIYTEDTELGSGKKTIEIKVEASDRYVCFTLHTNKQTLADALEEHKLVEGENGQYGLYIKSVNGIVADYNINQSYWSLCQSGEPLPTGADGVEITDGDKYELLYKK